MRHETASCPTGIPSTNLLALDEEGMNRLVQHFAWPRYRAGQILRWLYQRRVNDIHQMTDLGQGERTALASVATIPRWCSVDSTVDARLKPTSTTTWAPIRDRQYLPGRAWLRPKTPVRAWDSARAQSFPMPRQIPRAWRNCARGVV